MLKGKASGNIRLGLLLSAVGLMMLGVSFAAVPLYDLFCRVTGFGGTPRMGDGVVIDGGGEVGGEIKVRFDAGTETSLDWDFYPEEREVRVQLNEVNTHYYVARNNGDRAVRGVATFNVAPLTAGYYFAKIDCFCFSEQVLEPGEEVRMKVVYYVDGAIRDEDSDVRFTPAVTLSYTFFEKAGSDGL